MLLIALFLAILLNLPLCLRMPWKSFGSLGKRKGEGLADLFDLADFIDFMLLALLAGNTLPQAFISAANGVTKGNAGRMSSTVLAKTSCGCSFVEALAHSRKECSESYSEFLDTLCISARMGSDVGSTLQTMAFGLRNKACSVVEADAAKAPVRMLFPLVVFILPIIFILLGAGTMQTFFSSLSAI